ncbi:hypothetical protein DFP93_103319 [Aneurinibacillus soli]|uniref:Uncharacterized protein n=1 Tax=Aneurinibacillus soli TaxID=1500254 RepID=A0A0U4NJ86_9BACL|nr:hypothetical protein [Aneurinibacillus soli]PYE63106.1 hypothetical protein DFP93_103319 [Aneurinibacillus soli]BAU28836.1 hypothetical protein CB4_03013 [Aneurinibacillus soli]
MFRNELLSIVWEKGRVEVGELARLLNTTTDLVEMEANLCASNGWLRQLDSLIVATPSTNMQQ